MADLVVVVGVIAFFGICALSVVACDRIIGPDPAPGAVLDAGEDPESAAEVSR
jgi:hypothetical protein